MDIVWIIGLSILEVQSSNVDLIKQTIPEISASYDGAIGSTALNEAGDLGAANYEIWGIRDGVWESTGIYDFKLDSIK